MKNNIKQARERHGMQQKECADALGLSLRAWQTYEQGIREPKYSTLCDIANLFNVTTDYLLGREVKEAATVDKLAAEFNMTSLERRILDNYLLLPEDMRGDLMEFLRKSVREVQQESDV